MKTVRRNGKVIGGKEARLIGVAVVIGMPHLHDQLARHGIAVVRQCIQHSPSEDDGIRRRRIPYRQLLQPVGMRGTIIVRKGEYPTSRSARPPVPRRPWSSVPLLQHFDIESVTERSDDGVRQQGTPIVHDDHFKSIAWIVQTSQRVHAGRELPGPVVGRDDDRKDRLHVRHQASPARSRLMASACRATSSDQASSLRRSRSVKYSILNNSILANCSVASPAPNT